MTKGRLFLIAAQLTAVVLFMITYDEVRGGHPIAWAAPLFLVGLVLVNSFWFSRGVSWLIFATAFFCMVVVLTAFTLRFRTEAGFVSGPFYRTMIMYAAFVYVSLAQIKILGSQK